MLLSLFPPLHLCWKGPTSFSGVTSRSCVNLFQPANYFWSHRVTWTNWSCGAHIDLMGRWRRKESVMKGILHSESSLWMRIFLPPHPWTSSSSRPKTMCFYSGSLMTEWLVRRHFERKPSLIVGQQKVGSFGADCCGLGHLGPSRVGVSFFYFLLTHISIKMSQLSPSDLLDSS